MTFLIQQGRSYIHFVVMLSLNQALSRSRLHVK